MLAASEYFKDSKILKYLVTMLFVDHPRLDRLCKIEKNWLRDLIMIIVKPADHLNSAAFRLHPSALLG